MPVDERKIRLRAALAGKSTEELDDLLAMSFSEDAEPDVEYIEVILEVMRERDGKVETEEELNRAWADFKEFVKERESLEKEFAETEETSTETGVTEEPSHEHTRKTEYRQKPRRFSRIFRNALLVAAIIALLGSQAFGWNLFQAIAQWGTETFQFLTGRENTDASYRDVFEELRDVVSNMTETPAVPKRAPEGTTVTGALTKNERKNRHTISMAYSVDGRIFSVKITIYDTIPKELSGTYQKDQEIEETYPINGIDHYITGNIGNLTAMWTNNCVEGYIQGDLTLEEIHNMLDSIYEE